MTATLLFFMPDGVTDALPLDFGIVSPGEAGADLVRVLKNVGDTDATVTALGVRAVGATDLEDWLTGHVGGQTFSAAAPLALGTLAAGDAVSITYSLAVPAGTAEDDALHNALPYARWR